MMLAVYLSPQGALGAVKTTALRTSGEGLALQHDCVDFWCETVVVAPDGGMCKATTSAVK